MPKKIEIAERVIVACEDVPITELAEIVEVTVPECLKLVTDLKYKKICYLEVIDRTLHVKAFA